MKLIYPININSHIMTQGYKPGHEAVDFAPKDGQPKEVKAVADGTITFAGLSDPFGWYDPKLKKTVKKRNPVIKINHKQGVASEYHHLNGIYVKPGQEVRQGDIIGLSGNKGAVIASPGGTGVHLHFPLKINGKAVDPIPYLNGQDLFAPEAAVTPVKAWEYRVKEGGWISDIVGELNYAGLWNQKNDESAWNRFYSLNNPTPPGGYKPGTIVRWREEDKEIIETVAHTEATPIQDLLQSEKEPVVISLENLKQTTPVSQPENPTPKEVVEMAVNPAFNFEVKDVKVEPFHKVAVIESTKPVLAYLGGLWKKVPDWVGVPLLVLFSIMTESIINALTGIKANDVLISLPFNLSISIGAAQVSTLIVLGRQALSELKKRDDQYLIQTYVRS